MSTPTDTTISGSAGGKAMNPSVASEDTGLQVPDRDERADGGSSSTLPTTQSPSIPAQVNVNTGTNTQPTSSRNTNTGGNPNVPQKPLPALPRDYLAPPLRPHPLSHPPPSTLPWPRNILNTCLLFTSTMLHLIQQQSQTQTTPTSLVSPWTMEMVNQVVQNGIDVLGFVRREHTDAWMVGKGLREERVSLIFERDSLLADKERLQKRLAALEAVHSDVPMADRGEKMVEE